MQAKAIFLDRDGVLNQAIIKNGRPYPPSSLEELHWSVDVLPALELLKEQGYLLIGATNQPDVARGASERSLVEAINQALLQALPLDEIRVCYHDDRDHCLCRKPSPGLLLQAAKDHQLDLKKCVMIGDRWRDIEAGQRAGCKTVWLNYHYAEKGPETAPDFTAITLVEAADWISKLS